jgi:hypothetical protein
VLPEDDELWLLCHCSRHSRQNHRLRQWKGRDAVGKVGWGGIAICVSAECCSGCVTYYKLSVRHRLNGAMVEFERNITMFTLPGHRDGYHLQNDNTVCMLGNVGGNIEFDAEYTGL